MVDDSVVVEIIKYIPLQQGLRQIIYEYNLSRRYIIKYIPLQQGLRPANPAATNKTVYY